MNTPTFTAARCIVRNCKNKPKLLAAAQALASTSPLHATIVLLLNREVK